MFHYYKQTIRLPVSYERPLLFLVFISLKFPTLFGKREIIVMLVNMLRTLARCFLLFTSGATILLFYKKRLNVISSYPLQRYNFLLKSAIFILIFSAARSPACRTLPVCPRLGSALWWRLCRARSGSPAATPSAVRPMAGTVSRLHPARRGSVSD